MKKRCGQLGGYVEHFLRHLESKYFTWAGVQALLYRQKLLLGLTVD